MIICHCNRITDGQIIEVADRLRNENPDRPIRSNLIYRGCGCRPQCGCCRPSIDALLLSKGYDVTIAQRDEIARIRVPHYLDREKVEAGE
ncbi:hypothetical protein FDK21_10380 [Cohaesibacter sp. CAU 1516]|uniref:(2Fe-2S)-binding protein n=1 Tax=Cohaesibacter sp. CAU 1516 TaxID=2576038 RepID=UPI0010FF1787|nr:(2Fe-2S)-binding protein [Cohaesibacter sp. CAU 1516]TLP46021.1 hypothetical protein FDK21_10380 [Cohaesibacter sp. CAU 1516]